MTQTPSGVDRAKRTKARWHVRLQQVVLLFLGACLGSVVWIPIELSRGSDSVGSSRSTIVGVVTGIVVFFITRFVWDLYRQRTERMALMDALFVEASSTVLLVGDLLGKWRPHVETLDKEAPTTLAALKNLPEGSVFSAPEIELVEAATVLGPSEAPRVVLYIDAWARLRQFEARYREAFHRLTEALAQPTPSAALVGEYWQQMADNSRELLKVLKLTGNRARELCLRYIEIHREGLHWDEDIAAKIYLASSGRWQSSQDVPPPFE